MKKTYIVHTARKTEEEKQKHHHTTWLNCERDSFVPGKTNENATKNSIRLNLKSAIKYNENGGTKETLEHLLCGPCCWCHYTHNIHNTYYILCHSVKS